MSEYVCPDGRVIKITHIMADGSVRDSVKGYKIPYNEITAPAYGIIEGMIKRAIDLEKST